MTARRRQLPWILAAAGLAPLAQAEQSPYYIGASQNFSRDSNLLGLADGQAVPPGFESKADTISATSLLAGIDQPIGRQHLFGNLTLSDNRLSKNTVYNNQSYAITSGLDWSTVERVSGTLKFNANRNLARFNQTGVGLVLERNIQTTRQLDAGVTVGLVTRLSFEAGAGTNSVDYTAPAYQVLDFRQHYLSLGLRYRLSGANDVGFSLRQADGRYPSFFPQPDGSFLDDRFKRRDVGFDAHLVPSGASSLYAKLSFGSVHYDVAKQRDFSGVTGLLKWDWQAGGRLRFVTRISRDPAQDSYFFAAAISDATLDYSRVTTAVQIRADYDLTGKIGLYARVQTYHSLLSNDYSGVIAPVSGTENGNRFALGGTWNASRNIVLGCDWSRWQRRGEPPVSSNLGDTTFDCYLQGSLR